MACVPEALVGSYEADDAALADAAELDSELAAPDDAGCSGLTPTTDACPMVSTFDSQLLTVTLGPTTSYFSAGAALPAGDYTLAYVDGCWKSGVVAWTVNLGPSGYTIVGGQPETWIAMAPGTVGTFASLGAYSIYDECISANRGRAPVAFHFAGGPLGLKLAAPPDGDLVMRFTLLAGGASQGGSDPTFRLTCVAGCR